jgi:SPP1 gp7 family putative phage head morphogenesis protein
MQRIDLNQAVARKDARPPRLRRPRTLRPIGPTLACELALNAQFTRLLRKIATLVRQRGLPLVEGVRRDLGVGDNRGLVGDAQRVWDDATQLAAFTAMLRQQVDHDAGGMAGVIRAIFTQEAARNTGAYESAVRSTFGVDISSVLGAEDVAAYVEAAGIKSASYIRGIADELITRVEREILDGAAQGRRTKDVAKDLAAQFGWSQKRAKFIARDQTATLNGNLNQVRQTQLGIDRYEWSTSLDERVRPLHASFEGNVYSWDRPGPDDGLHPGQPINCRCVALAVVGQFTADAIAVEDAGFREEEHPRGPAGRFSDKPDQQGRKPWWLRARPVPLKPRIAQIMSRVAPIDSRWRTEVKRLAQAARAAGDEEAAKGLTAKIGESFYREGTNLLREGNQERGRRLRAKARELGYVAPAASAPAPAAPIPVIGVTAAPRPPGTPRPLTPAEDEQLMNTFILRNWQDGEAFVATSEATRTQGDERKYAIQQYLESEYRELGLHEVWQHAREYNMPWAAGTSTPEAKPPTAASARKPGDPWTKEQIAQEIEMFLGPEKFVTSRPVSVSPRYKDALIQVLQGSNIGLSEVIQRLGFGESREPIEVSMSGTNLNVGGNVIRDGKMAARMERSIDFDKKVAKSNYLRVMQTGGGLAKELLGSQIALYKDLGIERVEVHANLDVGGYSWAKYGYVPTQQSWNGSGYSSLAEGIKRKLDYIQDISGDLKTLIRALCDNPDPRTLHLIADLTTPVPSANNQSLGKAILLGSDWYGVLNLTDQPTVERFNAYISKKSK